MQHLQSMRGHQFAVYCISFDKAGRHIITGSDDTFVKVRDFGNFPLKRGHDSGTFTQLFQPGGSDSHRRTTPQLISKHLVAKQRHPALQPASSLQCVTSSG